MIPMSAPVPKPPLLTVLIGPVGFEGLLGFTGLVFPPLPPVFTLELGVVPPPLLLLSAG